MDRGREGERKGGRELERERERESVIRGEPHLHLLCRLILVWSPASLY